MAIDRPPQVVHDALADGVREVRLGDAERAGEHRDRHHPGDQQREQVGVALRDGGVEHLAQQEGRGHADQRGARDQPADGRQAAAIGAEESGDAHI